MNITLEQVAEKIKAAKTIAAFGHIKTDCDSVSGLLAFREMCLALGKQIDTFVDSEYDETFLHLPNLSVINSTKLKSNYDLYVSLDTATADRLGKYRNNFLVARNNLRIDHHPADSYAKAEYVDSSLPATCLILKKLQKLLKVKDTDTINFLLLSGTLSDTGCFKYNSTNEETFRLAADIVKGAKFNYSDAVTPLFQNVSKKRRMLQSFALSNAQFYFDDQIAVMALTKSDLDQLGCTLADTVGMSYLVQDISSVKIAILATEAKKGEFSVTYYGKGDIDVSVCARAFGGGGHKGAAGCKLYGGAKTVIKKLVDEAQRVLKGEN